MKLRCFFGLSHGKWVEAPESAEGKLQRTTGPFGSDYIPHDIAGRTVLVHEEHTIEEALDWLFTFQPDHPKHLDADNHPREQAKRAGEIERSGSPDID